MTLFADLLTGKFFRFRLATAADVIAGTSNTMLLTPKCLKDAGVTAAVDKPSIPFMLSQEVFTSFSSFSPGSLYGILPATSSVLHAKLYAYARADNGSTGEIALWDVAANAIVSGSQVSISSSSYQLKNSPEFAVTPGKVYTFAIRRASFQTGFTYLRTALLITL
jgi:hypothetical protein